MSKEFKMGFIEEVEPLKLTTIPKKYQKLIEATENHWFNKMQKLAKICQKRIDDLEHRLSNCIEPKFKIGQEVWVQWKGEIVKRKVIRLMWDYNEVIEYRISCGMYLVSYWEDEVFATEEEAKAKLREMQDENN